MATASKELNGYIKTESVMLIVLIALAAGFVGGVAFSAYRISNPMAPATTVQKNRPKEFTDHEKEHLAALIEKTKTTPDDTNAWIQLGHLYFDSGQPPLAIDAYERALQLDPEMPDIWTNAGVMHRRNGNPHKAIEFFNRALAIDQHHQIAWFNKGVVSRFDLNDTKAALEAWEKLVEINPQAKAPDGRLVQTLVEELTSSSPSN